jgi:hypothetical protein
MIMRVDQRGRKVLVMSRWWFGDHPKEIGEIEIAMNKQNVKI